MSGMHHPCFEVHTADLFSHGYEQFTVCSASMKLYMYTFQQASQVLYGHLHMTLSGLAGMFFLCKDASLIPLNKPNQAFGVSYEAQTDLGVSLTAPGQRFAAQCGCFLIVAPTQKF